MISPSALLLFLSFSSLLLICRPRLDSGKREIDFPFLFDFYNLNKALIALRSAPLDADQMIR